MLCRGKPRGLPCLYIQVLNVPKPDPAHADNEQNAYVFEHRVDIKYSNGDETRGFIDLYKRGCFVLEGKQFNSHLAHYSLANNI